MRDKQNTFWLHGFLYHTYQHALNNAPLFRNTFLPKKWSGWTIGAWIIVISMFGFWALWFVFALPPSSKDVKWPALISMLHVPLFLLVGEPALIWGISVRFEDNAALSNLPQQPSNMRRPILRQVFFGKALLHSGRKLPSIKELKNCIEFIDSNRVNVPKKWIELQHVIAILSMVVAVINTQISNHPNAPKIDGNFIVEIGLAAFGLLLLVGVIFGVMHSNLRDRWNFERSLRWYLIMREEETKDAESI